MFRRIVSAILAFAIVHTPIAASAAMFTAAQLRPAVRASKAFHTPLPRPTTVPLALGDQLKNLARAQARMIPIAVVKPAPFLASTDWHRAARDSRAIRLSTVRAGPVPTVPATASPRRLSGAEHPTVQLGTALPSVTPLPTAGIIVGPRSARSLRPASATIPASPTTGFEKWWTYNTGLLPGVGQYAVNAATGNFIVTSTDMKISHRGVPFVFTRTYNSQSLHDTNGSDGGPAALFGNGWTNTFDSYIALNANGTLSVYDDGGARIDYTATTNPAYPTGWMPPTGIHAQLSSNSDGSYDWTTKDGIIHRYWAPTGASCPSHAVCGRLQYIIGRNHYTFLKLIYAFSNADRALNHLVWITVAADDDTSAQPDRATLLMSDATGVPLVSGLIWPGGSTTVAYTYDAQSNLDAVYEAGTNAGTVAQGYTTVGGQLQHVTDPRYNAITAQPCSQGNDVQFWVDGNNRLTRILYLGVVDFAPADGVGLPLHSNDPPGTQNVAPGCSGFSEDDFAYGSGTTTVSDSDGHYGSYVFDALGRETQGSAYNGALSYTTTQTWDATNDLVSAVDVRGNRTAFAYDANGNTVAISEPMSASPSGSGNPTTLASFDANNNILTMCGSSYTAAHGLQWSGSGSPKACPAAPGTRYWYWAIPAPASSYEPYGQLKSWIAEDGYGHTIVYNPYSQGGSDFGEPTSVIGGAYAQVDNTTIAPQVDVTYDNHGNATSYNVMTGAWYFTYSSDNLNRVIQVKDPDNVIGYQYWYPNGQLAGSETASQHAFEVKKPGSGRVSYSYDLDGNEITETHHHGGVAGVTRKWYDGADRLVETSLPVDATDKYYPAPWLTRYKYDITAGGTNYFADSVRGAHPLTGRGGVYAVDLYIPPASGAAATGWLDVSGVSRDQLDRATTSYSLSPAAGSQPLQTFSATYDSSPNFLGWLTASSDALGHTATYAYDSAGRTTAVQYTDGSRANIFSYDWNGQLASASLGSLGNFRDVGLESFTYDAVGRLASYIEPSTTPVTSPATYTYGRYPDGTTKTLSVKSSALNVTNLFSYNRRVDGLLKSQSVQYPADARAKQTFSWTYSPAGRFNSAGDDIKSTASSVMYNLTGTPTQYTIPAGQYIALAYDPEGNLLNSAGYPIGPNNATVGTSYTYNVRGELIASNTQPTTGFIPNYKVHSNEGVDLPDPSNGGIFASSIAYDALNGAKLGQHIPSSTKYGAAATIDSSFAYDANGRMTAKTDTVSGGQNATVTSQRTYDFNNHVTGSTCTPSNLCSGSDALGYLWTATNNLVLITGDLARSGQSGYGAGQSETLHWANGQLLFTTNANGTLDDLKIGQLADITTLPGTSGGKPGLTIWDRQLDGRQTSWHSSAGVGKWLPPGDPTQGYNLAHPDDRGILPVQLPTTDGFTDRHNVFQGARVYDYDANQWTSPDAAAGSLENPFSFRRYLYDNGNPNSNSDPSGNCTVTATNPPTIGCVDSNKPAPSAAPGADSNNVIGLVVYVIDHFQPI